MRVAAWTDWKTKSFGALTKDQRRDMKKVKEIDLAYREGVLLELDQTQAELLRKCFSQSCAQYDNKD